jgi:hypothetical protein
MIHQHIDTDKYRFGRTPKPLTFLVEVRGFFVPASTPQRLAQRSKVDMSGFLNVPRS